MKKVLEAQVKINEVAEKLIPILGADMTAQVLFNAAIKIALSNYTKESVMQFLQENMAMLEGELEIKKKNKRTLAGLLFN